MTDQTGVDSGQTHVVISRSETSIEDSPLGVRWEDEANANYYSPGICPGAPSRKQAVNVVHSILENDLSTLQKLAEEDDDDFPGFHDLCHGEWLSWDAETQRPKLSEYAWIPPILFAARWASPETVKFLIDQGVDVQAKSHRGENALVALCAQPPASRNFAEELQGHMAPSTVHAYTTRRFLQFPTLDQENSDVDGEKLEKPKNDGKKSGIHGENSSTEVEVSAELEEIREKLINMRNAEMVLISKVLITSGCDPAEPDRTGLTALDYAAMFHHTEISAVLNDLSARPKFVQQLRKVDQQIPLEEGCCTPTQRKTRTKEHDQDEQAALLTPPSLHLYENDGREMHTPEQSWTYDTPLTNAHMPLTSLSTMSTGCYSLGSRTQTTRRRVLNDQLKYDGLKDFNDNKENDRFFANSKHHLKKQAAANQDLQDIQQATKDITFSAVQ